MSARRASFQGAALLRIAESGEKPQPCGKLGIPNIGAERGPFRMWGCKQQVDEIVKVYNEK
jgi:hypothetical protein